VENHVGAIPDLASFRSSSSIDKSVGRLFNIFEISNYQFSQSAGRDWKEGEANDFARRRIVDHELYHHLMT
jgi:hypothetical protein